MRYSTLSQPGQIFANLPGILGFYPQESIVIITFQDSHKDKGGWSATIGPVFRLDLKDLRYCADLSDALSQIPHDFLIALIVSKQDGDVIDNAVNYLMGLGSSNVLELVACWKMNEINNGAAYDLKFVLDSFAAEEVLSNGWYHGHLQPIHSTASMQAMAKKGFLPDLHREDARECFSIQSPFTQTQQRCIVREAERDGWKLASQLSTSPRILQDVLEEFEEELLRCKVRRLDLDDAIFFSTHLVDFHVRDAITSLLWSHRQLATDLTLKLARTTSGLIRANALSLHAILCFGQFPDHYVLTALELAGEACSDHRLSTLLLRGYRVGIAENMINSIRNSAQNGQRSSGYEPEELDGAA